MQRSLSTLAYKYPNLIPPITNLFPMHPPHPIMLLAVLLYLMLSFPPLTRLGFLNKMPEIFGSAIPNFFTVSRFIMWNLSASSNQTSTRLPRSESLNTLLCDLIAFLHRSNCIILHFYRSQPIWHFFPNQPHDSGGAIIIVRQGLSFLFRLAPTLTMQGSTSH